MIGNGAESFMHPRNRVIRWNGPDETDGLRVERDGSTSSYPNGRVEPMCNGDRDGSIEAVGQCVVLAKGDSSVWAPDLERLGHLAC
jgi:hypothetical protein